jgi:catechol-2,3-dioxygenase
MYVKKPSHLGLRHLALYVHQLEKCTAFYCDILGMQIVWQPDNDNIYLSSGTDNLALHRAKEARDPNAKEALDHFGFFLATPEAVDEWHTYLLEHDVPIAFPPKNHRDGSKSVYCTDPEGNVIQLIYYPA